MASDVITQGESQYSANRKRVLLVDEEAADLKMLRVTLEGQGFQVSACTTYEAGIQCLEDQPFDFVLVSQGTPAFEGRHLLGRAMELDRHRPVLVVTRCLEMACYLEAMQLGAIDYIVKPIPPADLLRFVRAHTHNDRQRRIGGSDKATPNA